MNIAIVILLSLEMIVGLIINIMKIIIVKANKHITWELEIYSSVICINYFILSTVLDAIEYTCSETGFFLDLMIHFIAPLFKVFGVNIILFHSFSVAFYKYYITLHKPSANNGDKNMDWKWLSFLIVFPILWTVINLLRNIDNVMLMMSPIPGCQSSGFHDQMSLFCNFEDESDNGKKWTFVFITTQIYCLIHSGVNILLKLNLLEAFLYMKIFRFMNR